MIRAALVLLASIGIASATRPSPAATPVARQQAAEPRFRSATDAVRVDVLVMDGRRPVSGLTAADFELRDSGVPQQIDDIQLVEVPFSVMLALDTSSSMQIGLPRLKDAARAAVDTLHADDRASVVTFAENISAPTPWRAPRAAVLDAIDSLYAAGSTNLVDAAFAAMMFEDPEPSRRNLVILFTDGSDTSSWLPDNAALDLAARTDVVVYCVAIEEPRDDGRRHLEQRSGIRLNRREPIVRSQDFLEQLAVSTGGERLSTDFGSLQKTFRQVVNDFRSRYVLSYTPRGVAGIGWHPLEVRIKGKRYHVTARRGYQRQGAGS